MNENFIEFKDVCFRYHNTTNSFSLENINLSIKKGEYITIIGNSGAGKSTFSRFINGILRPSEGNIIVDGLNTKDNSKIWDIRKRIGIVFQNPDNQLIGTTIKEEVAFGPENLGVSPNIISQRVIDNLRIVGLVGNINQSSTNLSGGQKQKLAIASILAMEPDCIILDEATSMIDPTERKEIMNIVSELNSKKEITIINITHSFKEIFQSHRVIVMSKGRIIADKTPRELFSSCDELVEADIEIPAIIRLFNDLRLEGIHLPDNIVNVDEAFNSLCKIIQQSLY